MRMHYLVGIPIPKVSKMSQINNQQVSRATKQSTRATLGLYYNSKHGQHLSCVALLNAPGDPDLVRIAKKSRSGSQHSQCTASPSIQYSSSQSGFWIVWPVKSRREDRLVGQEGRRGLDLTEIFCPVKSGPVKDWSNMGSLQAAAEFA